MRFILRVIKNFIIATLLLTGAIVGGVLVLVKRRN